MTAQKGVSMLLKIGPQASATTVAGLQVTTMTLNNEIVDVTTKDFERLENAVAGRWDSVDPDDSQWHRAGQLGIQVPTVKRLQQHRQRVHDGVREWRLHRRQLPDQQVRGVRAYNKEQTFTCTLESSGQPTLSIS